MLAFAAGGMLYVASDTGMVFAVEEATGSLAWSTQADGLGTLADGRGPGSAAHQLYASGGIVAYAHADVSDAGVVLGDGGASAPFDL